jgi:hypothetical protein
MQLNLRLITRFFLPLSITTIAVVVGNDSANAKEATRLIRYSSRAADLMIKEPVTIAQASGGSSGSTPGSSGPSSTTPSTSPSTVNQSPSQPGGTTPGGTITPTMPGTITPTTPDTTTPGTITPTTPGTITPTTPDTITPEVTPSTTPGPDAPSQQVPTGTQELAPGRPNRSGSSYVGVGGNIGIGDGDSGLSNSGFAIISKIGLTRNFSVRPSVLFNGGNVTVLAPVTYEFGDVGSALTAGYGFSVNPYLGIGVGIGTGDDSNTGLLVSGGVDVPISRDFTATGAVNAVVTGDTAVGVLLGIGYNFAGF